jgi:hypothetical protein
MPMYDSLADQIKYFLLNGGDYHLAPNLGADVLDCADEFLARLLVHQADYYRHTHVLWMAHTSSTDCWRYTPRLLFVSPEPGCGKSLALTITERLVARAEYASDLSPAGLYYLIEEARRNKGGRPTILYDELDTVFGNFETGRRINEDMRRLINMGHDRHEKLVRKIGKEVKRFQLYAPMALAGKMGVDDVPSTIRDRSVVSPMQRALPHEEAEYWDDYLHGPEADEVCWLLRYWAELVHSDALHYVSRDHPLLPTGVRNRNRDKWVPLLTMGELAGGHWAQRARDACVALVALSGETVPSRGLDLLTDIRTIFDKLPGGVIFTVDLLAELVKIDPEWRSLNGKRLAAMLRSYGITETHRDQRIGTVHRKGYRREYFEEAWARYLPPRAPRETRATDGDGDGDDE